MATESIFSFISRQDDGLWTARHGHFTLKTALQPIFRQRLDGALQSIGSEGLLRPYIDDLAMAPAQFFASADLPLVENVDCLSRMIHVLNHGQVQNNHDQLIFVSFHPAILQSTEHILRALERLQICAEQADLQPVQIVCQMSSRNQPKAERLNFFAQSVREAGLQLAISHIDDGAYALPNVFSLRPDYLKLTSDWIRLGLHSQPASHLLKRIIERCAVLDIKPILTGIESASHLSFCRGLHPVFLQGHLLSKPQLIEGAIAGDWPNLLQPIEASRQTPRKRLRKKLFAEAFTPSHLTQSRKFQHFGKRRHN